MKALLVETAIAEDLARRIGEHLQTDWQIIAAGEDTNTPPETVANAEAMIGHRLPADIIRRALAVRLVQCTGAGINGIDTHAIPPGAALCNVYEHEVPIAEYVMMGMLMCACSVKQRDADMRRGEWTGSGRVFGAFHDEIFGSTIGVIGLGRIGCEVAHRARAFGMSVLALRRTAGAHPMVDRVFDYDHMSDFLAVCDYVAVTCPLADETRNLIDAAALGQMKPSAVLINPSRGEIVEEQPLYDALSQGRIKAAVLDTWYSYPPPGEVGYGSRFPFQELDNVVMTPHLSAWTEPMLDRRMRTIAENLDRLARGEALRNRIDLASNF